MESSKSLTVIFQLLETRKHEMSTDTITDALANAIERSLIVEDFTPEEIERFDGIESFNSQDIRKKVHSIVKRHEGGADPMERLTKRVDAFWKKAGDTYLHIYLCYLDDKEYIYELREDGEWRITTRGQFNSE